MKKLLGFIVFIVIVIGGLFAYYKYDCKSNRSFIVWAQEKVGLYTTKDGHFKEDTNYSGSLGDFDVQTDFKFNKDGTGSIVIKMSVGGEVHEEAQEFTYKIDGSIISITSTNEDGTESTEYLYFFKEVVAYEMRLFGMSLPICCTQEGEAVSQNSSTKIIGYFFDISVNKGDLINVFNGKKESETTAASKGKAYAVYANGTISADPGYLNADQIIGFDSTEKGVKVVEVKIGNKNYKALLHVQ